MRGWAEWELWEALPGTWLGHLAPAPPLAETHGALGYAGICFFEHDQGAVGGAIEGAFGPCLIGSGDRILLRGRWEAAVDHQAAVFALVAIGFVSPSQSPLRVVAEGTRPLTKRFSLRLICRFQNPLRLSASCRSEESPRFEHNPSSTDRTARLKERGRPRPRAPRPRRNCRAARRFPTPSHRLPPPDPSQKPSGKPQKSSGCSEKPLRNPEKPLRNREISLRNPEISLRKPDISLRDS